MADGAFLELPSAGAVNAQAGHVISLPRPVSDARTGELASHLLDA
jgi:hypothetical protein